ncbi:MAG TPA: hypothetical protein DDX09_11400 [Hyphomonas atlantica]|nr:hypothetical protein [Hyphomonas atlantica]HBH43495.1 hypothetical protein [Hyphomonas atlantica]
MNRLIAALALATCPLAACVTAPEPCTQEWVEYKTDHILGEFASDNRGLINDLKRITNDQGDLNTFATMRLMSRTDDLQNFADSFQNVVLPELELALVECGQSEQFAPALTGFLRDEGVDEEALQWVAPIIGLMQQLREDEVGNSSQVM